MEERSAFPRIPQRLAEKPWFALQHWKDIIILVLAALNIWIWAGASRGDLDRLPHIKAELNEFGIDTALSQDKSYKQFTPYHSADPREREAVNSAWDNIVTDHGIVALDTDWASKRGLPPSMKLPSDQSKSLYFLEAYHQLHCVVTARKAFYDLLEGRAIALPSEHYSHCFDAMVQDITCSPSTELRYSYGQRPINQTQTRRCASWEALRDWAEAHSPCDPSDVTGQNLVIPNQLCHGGTDGLLAY